jgi:hypothetical protein
LRQYGIVAVQKAFFLICLNCPENSIYYPARAVEMRRMYQKQMEQLEREENYRQTTTTNFSMAG